MVVKRLYSNEGALFAKQRNMAITIAILHQQRRQARMFKSHSWKNWA
jgi:hypothetical protein